MTEQKNNCLFCFALNRSAVIRHDCTISSTGCLFSDALSAAQLRNDDEMTVSASLLCGFIVASDDMSGAQEDPQTMTSSRLMP